MMSVQQRLNTISHPLVASMYLKKDFGDKNHGSQEDVLVIETAFHETTPLRDAFLTELLFDLQEIHELAEERIGKFDRIDIRTPAPVF